MTAMRGWEQHIAAYGQAQRERNFADSTVHQRQRALQLFAHWCDERSLESPSAVTRPVLERYRHHLYAYRQKNGKPLSVSSQCNHLFAVKMFFRWLMRQSIIDANPASELEMPRQPVRIPKDILTPAEVEQIMAVPNLLQPLGLRDRAILEVFYSTGIRRMELCNLLVSDVDYGRGTLFIRQGKGKRDRFVPIGERALHWVDRYQREVRSLLVCDAGEQRLFLNFNGGPLAKEALGHEVRRYVEESGIGKQGACHLFRHTCGTLMHEGGADIRYVQEMLGHARITSTEVYTRVSVARLKEVHDATHPGALDGEPAA